MSDQKSNMNPFIKFFIEALGSTMGKLVAWVLVAVIGVGGTAIALEMSFVSAAIMILVVGIAVGVLAFLGNIFG